MNAINFTSPPVSNPSISTKNLSFLSLNSSKNTPKFLSFCSTKPHTTNDNTAEENPNNSDSNSIFESNVISSNENQDNPTKSTYKHSPPSPTTSVSSGLVFDLGLNESWDSIEIGSPVVKRFLSDEQERWYMWYYGRSGKNPGSDSIGLAVSSNGVHWQRGEEEVMNSNTKVGLVMKCGGDWWSFDTMSIRPSDIMIMSSSKVRAASGVYWLYYTGFSSEEIELPEDLCITTQFGLLNPERAQTGGKKTGNYGVGTVFRSLPGLAMSQDGMNWARIEGDHHSGALFDVGSNGEWDSLFISSPHVVFHSKGDLRMYYHSFDVQDGSFSIGIARSRDGIKWVKLGKIIGGSKSDGSFDEKGVMNACVVKDKKVGNYLMAYEGVGEDGKSSIGLSVSSDGLKDWRRINEGPILKGCFEEGWDNSGVGSPCLVEMEGDEDRWRLYYRGVGKDGRTGIGLAVSKGSEITNFKRWAGFHF